VSKRGARWLLFATALLTLPVPFYLGEPELAPVLRLAFLTGLVTMVFAAEGGGVTASLAGIGGVQVLAWAALLFGAAAAIARVGSARARTAIAVAISLALLAASFTERYDTPLSSTRSRSNLLQLFQ
jgi:hypothetical protein